MRFLRPSSVLVLAAGVLTLAPAAQAQTRAAANDEGVKGAKRAQTAVTPQPAGSPQPHRKTEPKDHGDDPEMIMLQEPFRGGAAMPVSITHGR